MTTTTHPLPRPSPSLDFTSPHLPHDTTTTVTTVAPFVYKHERVYICTLLFASGRRPDGPYVFTASVTTRLTSFSDLPGLCGFLLRESVSVDVCFSLRGLLMSCFTFFIYLPLTGTGCAAYF